MGVDDGIIFGFFCHTDEFGGFEIWLALIYQMCFSFCLCLLVEVVDGLMERSGKLCPTRP